MSLVIQVKTTVLPGRRIEVGAPELPEGRGVTVLILVDDEERTPKRKLSAVLASYPGGRLFRTAQEVDNYLRLERDAWEH